MSNAPKPAVKALFAAMAAAQEADERNSAALTKFPAEPPTGKAIEVDLVWLSMRGVKGRA